MMAWSEAKWITDEIQKRYNLINDKLIKLPQKVSCFQVVQIEGSNYLRIEAPGRTKKIDVLFNSDKVLSENRVSYFLVKVPESALHENVNLSFHAYSNEKAENFVTSDYNVDLSNIKKYAINFTDIDDNIEDDRVIGVLKDGNGLCTEIITGRKSIDFFVTGKTRKLEFISCLSNVPNKQINLYADQINVSLEPYDCSVNFTSQDEIAEVIINRLDNDEIYQYKAPCKSIYQFKIENIKVNSTLDLSIRFKVGKTVQFTHTFKKHGECWASNVKAYKVYGVRRLVGSTAVNWERTDDNKDNLNFDKLYPWNKIRVINDYTYIPVFYYKREVQNGFDCIKICEAPIAGFVKHPASGYGVGKGYNRRINEGDIDFYNFKGDLPNGLTAQVFFGVMLLSVIENGCYKSLSQSPYYRNFEFSNELYIILNGYTAIKKGYSDYEKSKIEFYENDKKVIFPSKTYKDGETLCEPDLPWLIGAFTGDDVNKGEYPFLIYGIGAYGVYKFNNVSFDNSKENICSQKYLGDNL